MTDAAALQGWTPAALIDRFASFGDAPALLSVHGESIRSVSYAALSERVRSLAAGLSASGIGPGTTVALIAPNGCVWVIARFALAAVGAVVAALDDLSTEAELRTALADIGCRHVIASARHVATIHAIDPALDVIVTGEAPAPAGAHVWQDLFITPSASALAQSFDAPALLTYTSGTTGPPKGFLLSYANLWANLRPLAKSRLIGPGDRVLLPLPLHHIYPFLVGLLTPLSVGATVVFPESISGPELLRAIRVTEVSAIVGVPRLYAALASGLEARIAAHGWAVSIAFRAMLASSIGLKRRFRVGAGYWLFRRLRAGIGPKLHLLVSGGAHLDRETLWPLVGLGFQVRSGYGLAETASIFTGNLPDVERLESEGKPFQGGTMRIAEPDADGVGEIKLIGPNVFTGYRNNPDANRDAFTANGWFRTGDLGRIDADGYLYVTGRRKETIVLGGGKKVNPEELERIYGASPYLREIAVLERQGSLVALVLPDFEALRRGPSARIDETIRVALASQSQSLPSYQRLAGVALVREPMPRTRLGKYRRFLLQALYERALSGETVAAPHAPSPEDEALLSAPRPRQLYDFLVERYAGKMVHLDANPLLDLGIDSLEWVSLSLALEQRGLTISERASADATTIRDLLRAVQAEASAQGQLEEREPSLLDEHWLEPPGLGLKMLGIVLYLVDWFLVRLLFRLRVQGADNLPVHGPYLLAANHGSDLDALMISAALGYRRASRLYWSGDVMRLFRRRWLHPLWRALHVFPADDRLPGRTLALAEAVLRRGNDLVWFPEGWRTPDGRLQHFLPGVGRILARTRVAAVPIYVSGTFEAMPRNRCIPRLRPVRVLIGRPLPPWEEPDNAACHQRIADKLREAIAALERDARN
jgi:long-chain acyl-CoA synthetase